MHIARARPQLPENAVEQRRLAAAVGTDDAEYLASVDVERHPVDRDDAAEALLEVAHREHRSHRAPSPGTAASGRVTGASAAPLPAGLVRRSARPSRPEGHSAISTITRTA